VLAGFRDRHFRVVTHEYLVLHSGSPLFAEAETNGCLPDVAYPRLASAHPGAVNYKEGQRLLDFSRQEVGAWWWRAHGICSISGLPAGGTTGRSCSCASRGIRPVRGSCGD
jgi:hypothetical protein